MITGVTGVIGETRARVTGASKEEKEKEKEKMSPWWDKRTTRKARTTQPMDAGRQR